MLTNGRDVEVDSYDAKTSQKTPLYIAPISEQDPLESRRAWQKVQEAIGRGDLEMTGFEKSKIENKQREMRRLEKEEGREWERRYFSRVDDEPIFAKLAAKRDIVSESDRTNGIWVFDQDKYKALLARKKEEGEEEEEEKVEMEGEEKAEQEQGQERAVADTEARP